MITVAEKRATFRSLHERGCFVLPNPWDVGSARYFEHAGFKALASTSGGFAWTKGLADNLVPRDLMLAHLAELVEATSLPVNADYENAYAHDAAGAAENVRLAIETGIAGVSLEDTSSDEAYPIYGFDHAVARVKAVRAAVDKAAPDVILVARTDGLLHGLIDLPEVIRRLTAFANAGADCLYAPGLRKPEDIAAVVKAVAPKPVNLLMPAGGALPFAAVEALGVRRISVGSAMARVAWGAVMRSVKEITEHGRFDAFTDAMPYADINGFFQADMKR